MISLMEHIITKDVRDRILGLSPLDKLSIYMDYFIYETVRNKDFGIGLVEDRYHVSERDYAYRFGSVFYTAHHAVPLNSLAKNGYGLIYSMEEFYEYGVFLWVVIMQEQYQFLFPDGFKPYPPF